MIPAYRAGRPLLWTRRGVVERVDGARVEIQMIRVGARRVVIGILRRLNPQAARHVQDVGNADLRARIIVTLPFGNGRRLRQLIHALFDQDSHQRGRHALAHRPTFEGSVRGDASGVPLADDPSSPRHDESRSQLCRRLKRRVDGLLHFGRVDLWRERGLRQHIAHRPRLRRGIG